jgi:hypothetical protein
MAKNLDRIETLGSTDCTYTHACWRLECLLVSSGSAKRTVRLQSRLGGTAASSTLLYTIVGNYKDTITMRKVSSGLVKRGSRKKQNFDAPIEPREEQPSPRPRPVQVQQPVPVEVPRQEMRELPSQRRKVTKDEADLTTKNYRLAKELVSRKY